MNKKAGQTKNKAASKARRPTKRRQAAYFFTSFLTTLAVIGTIAGVMVVDFRSRAIGWNEGGASLAFSPQNGGMRMTVLGRSMDLPELPKTTEAPFTNIRAAWEVLEPPTARFTDDLRYALTPLARQTQQKLHDAVSDTFGFS